jgi:hypothetical protein
MTDFTGDPMNCPGCGEKLDTFLYFLVRPGFISRNCPACMAKLQFQNAGLGIIAAGITFSVSFFVLLLYEVSYLWLWLLLLSMFCAVVNAAFNSMFGSYTIWSISESEFQKRRQLFIQEQISFLTACTWIVYMIVSLSLGYVKIFQDTGDLDSILPAMDNFRKLVEERIMSTRGFIELVIGMASFIWIGTCRFRTALFNSNPKKSELDMS